MNQTQASHQRVWAAKADPAWCLHLNAVCDSHTFVLFSSIAALLGGVGQASYAAANTSLDQLAQWRLEQGLVAVSFQWGPWAAAGMAAQSGAAEDLSKQGITALHHQLGLSVMELAMCSANLPVIAVVMLNWPKFSASMEGRLPGILSKLAAPYMHTPSSNQHVSAVLTNDLTRELGNMSEDQRVTQLQTLILKHVANVGEQDVLLDVPLMDAGIDSVAAVELRDQLSQALGDVPLEAGLLFSHPTVNNLASYFDTMLFKTGISTMGDRPSSFLPQRFMPEHSATSIRGAACSLPGSARSPVRLWSSLTQAHDSVLPIPLQRFDANLLDGTPSSLNVKVGHFVEDIQVSAFSYIYLIPKVTCVCVLSDV